jgi:23S rRNA (adenine2503-C2)-methyltransferase
VPTRPMDPRPDWLEASPAGGYEEMARRLGLAAYRGRQVQSWVLRRFVRDFAAMTDLPQQVRRMLAQHTRVGGELKLVQVARDQTYKVLYALGDGEAVEAVSLSHRFGRTACVSTQVGCKMGCRFCASGLLGFGRQLTGGEMLGQVVALAGLTPGQPIRRVVLMGMGEPLDNLDEVMAFLDMAHHPAGLGLSWRHLTVSTAGLVPGIYRLAQSGRKVRLAISLHSAQEEVRRSLMPIARAYSLPELAQAALAYGRATGHRVTYEYALIRGVNDTPEALRALLAFLQRAPGHVNLIPWNPVPETGLARPEPHTMRSFARALKDAGHPVTFRRELGRDIDAACGQLRRRLAGGTAPVGGVHRHPGGPAKPAERGLRLGHPAV